MEIGAQQHLSIGSCGQSSKQPDAVSHETRVDGTASRRPLFELVSPEVTHLLQRPEPVTDDGSRHSRRSNRAMTVSCSNSGAVARAVPGTHRSIRNAMVSSSNASTSWRRTLPLPAHAMSPSASCSASECRHATFRTRSSRAPRRTGATHAVRPPGWNGRSTSNAQRRASSHTVAGRRANQPRRRAPDSDLIASTRLWGSTNSSTRQC